MEKEPWIWIVVGPNGVGKSTFIARQDTPFHGISYLDPEESIGRVFRDFSVSGVENFLIKLEEFCNARNSFVVETTFPGGTYTNLISRLRQEGWKIGVVCIGVATPEISRQRVDRRDTACGHGAFKAQLEGMWNSYPTPTARLLRLADSFSIYDNSTKDFLLGIMHLTYHVCRRILSKTGRHIRMREL